MARRRITARDAEVYVVGSGSYGRSKSALRRIRRLEGLAAAETAVCQRFVSSRPSSDSGSLVKRRPDALN
jgi:hypothetical protein